MEEKKSEIILYEALDGQTRIAILAGDETVWLTQSQMADLFHTTQQNVGQHIKNVFLEGELMVDSVVKEFFITASDGKAYPTKHYNLKEVAAILAKRSLRNLGLFRIAILNQILIEL